MGSSENFSAAQRNPIHINLCKHHDATPKCNLSVAGREKIHFSMNHKTALSFLGIFSHLSPINANPFLDNGDFSSVN